MSELTLGWVSPYRIEQKQGGWRGINYYLFEALLRHNKSLKNLAPIQPRRDFLAKWKSNCLTLMVGKRLVWNCSNRYLRLVAKSFLNKSKHSNVDAYIFFGCTAFYKILPKKVWTCYLDSAFVPFLDFEARHRNYLKSEFKRIRSLEKAWLHHAAKVFTSSEFARGRILEWYEMPPDKVVCVGVGPSLDYEVCKKPHVEKKPAILFVGSNFYNKGGDIAVETVALARKKIPDLELHIVGEMPPQKFQHDYVKCHGWIDRNDLEGRLKWDRIMNTCPLLLCAPKYDLAPTAICEAYAFGLPVMSYAVGGIPDMVIDGKTGWLMPHNSSCEKIASNLVDALSKQKILQAYGENARKAYEDFWNWDQVAHKMIKSIDSTIRNH